jgi:hypothetical protein
MTQNRRTHAMTTGNTRTVIAAIDGKWTDALGAAVECAGVSQARDDARREVEFGMSNV